MASYFKTWTVLPHEPIEKLSENLWCVRAKLDARVDRKMTVARMNDGGLVVHNGIALEEAAMKELEAFGAPRVLVVPNGYHRQDAFIWKQRYPSLMVVCPKGATKAVSKVVAVDGSYEDAPFDESVRLHDFEGVKAREGYLEVRSRDGVTIVVNDMVNNFKQRLGPLHDFMVGPTGRPCCPRVMRWIVVADGSALKAHLERLAATSGLRRLIVSHGWNVDDGAADALKSAAATL